MCLIIRLLYKIYHNSVHCVGKKDSFMFFCFISRIAKRYIISVNMSETAYIDELLKAEQEATEIIENAQKERYT